MTKRSLSLSFICNQLTNFLLNDQTLIAFSSNNDHFPYLSGFPTYPASAYDKGPGHSMECEAFFSMEVKAAIPWSCYAFNSMEFHGIAGLTVSKCMAVDSMERFHTIAGLTLGMRKSCKVYFYL